MNSISHLRIERRGQGMFVWLASRLDIAASWSQAGGVCRHAAAGLWWVAVERENWPQDEEYRKLIDAKWVESWGNRRQELVFIGIGMDREAIEMSLEACLLNTVEMARGPTAWSSYPDPFPVWTRIEEE